MSFSSPISNNNYNIIISCLLSRNVWHNKTCQICRILLVFASTIKTTPWFKQGTITFAYFMEMWFVLLESLIMAKLNGVQHFVLRRIEKPERSLVCLLESRYKRIEVFAYKSLLYSIGVWGVYINRFLYEVRLML